jgi:hypothetical protein
LVARGEQVGDPQLVDDEEQDDEPGGDEQFTEAAQQYSDDRAGAGGATPRANRSESGVRRRVEPRP